MKNIRDFLEYKAYRLRLSSLESTTAAGSGHPTSCLSAADIVAALFFEIMDVTDYTTRLNCDRFILSKGHAAPVLYAAWSELGLLKHEDLLSLRTFNSLLEGHPTPRLPLVDTATGSLGIGLSIGVGIALEAARKREHFYTYVLMGDSETSEGSVWEAAQLAYFYKLNHLIAIVDVNRLGQSTQTMNDYRFDRFEAMWSAFGWHTMCIDGHDVMEIVSACRKAQTFTDQPTVILAKTIKGYGVPSVENKEGFHGKVFMRQELPEKIHELQATCSHAASLKFPEVPYHQPKPRLPLEIPQFSPPKPPYRVGEKIATRRAYGDALAAYGAHVPELVCLDAETKNSTYADIFEKKIS